ncbi:hypothetical protein CL614_08190 [archaeon]|jgi:hypothetical protein|nr:hypothetical protein [archaeon]|tara:strand:+ start:370 stop:555 length:186 start_codon:yes stop_codon:yes gene_type:complete
MANTTSVSRQNQLDIKEIKTDVKHIRANMVPAREFYRLQGAVIVVGTLLMSSVGYLFSLTK